MRNEEANNENINNEEIKSQMMQDNAIDEKVDYRATHIDKEADVKRKEPRNNKGKMIFNGLKRILIIAILMLITVFVLKTSKYYVDDSITDKANLIINNNNVTARLKEDLIIEDEIVYLSMKDIQNFLDNYVYEETETEQVITSSDKKIAAISFEEKTMVLNGENTEIKATAIKRDGEIYLPISELGDVYDMDIEYIKDTEIVTLDSLDREQKKATVSQKVNVKLYPRVLSRTVDKINKSDSVIIIKQYSTGWTKVRTENGKIGYIQTNKLTDIETVREEAEEISQIDGKINMFWDSYTQYVSAPNRTGEEVEGVNVVSPTFFYINSEGEFTEKVGEAGKRYIKWAKQNGYKVWAMLSNSETKINVTSKILNSYENRQELIEKIVKACEKYDLDGINIDFEYMYEADKDMFSRFIIELVPRMKEMGVITSVDLTAPDGSPNWSLCYDRYVLGKVADYLVFMAYDQHVKSGEIAGTTAGYDWIELGLNKFITTYEVDSEKIILGMPFFTVVWTETADGILSGRAVYMKSLDKIIPEDVERVWKDDVKQYYVEYKEGATIKRIWIEDETSIKEKVSLVSKYNLAGVACWEKDMEPEEIWKVIKEGLEE